MNLPPPPSCSAGHAPVRRPGSVRRTSSIDMAWPEGREKAMRMDSRARDVHTPVGDGALQVLAHDEVLARVGPDRSIEAIESRPPRPAVAGMVGVRGGGKLRQALDAALPEEGREGHPLYLLIDDFAGASLIGGWVWSRWMKNWLPSWASPEDEEEARALRTANFGGVCTGFRPGSVALGDIRAQLQNSQVVLPLPNPADPQGWHAMPADPVPPQPTMRRARRIDVWEDELVHIDTMFQDSGTLPEGGRAAVHEYAVNLTVDPQSLRILTVQPRPCVLPYPECPSAVDNVQRLVGLDLPGLRTTVLETLPRTLGCTHLNDCMRALADVPALLRHLRHAQAR